jgi:hypothetical protein
MSRVNDLRDTTIRALRPFLYQLPQSLFRSKHRFLEQYLVIRLAPRQWPSVVPALAQQPPLLRPRRCIYDSTKTYLRVDVIELRQQYDALLLVRIGARNHRNATFRRAEIIRQMEHISRDIDKVPG